MIGTRLRNRFSGGRISTADTRKIPVPSTSKEEFSMDKNKVDYGPMEFATRAIKYGEGPDPVTHALNTPIYETTTYAYNETDEYDRMIGDAMAWKPGCRIYSRTIMPGIIGAFQAQYPNIEVRILESGNKSLQTSLINKDVDLAVGRIFDTLPNTEILDFYNDETVMLVPVEFAPEAAGKNTHLTDVSQFSRCPFVLGGGHDISSEIGKGLIEKSGFQPIVKARSNNLDTLVEFCSKGIGICFCPKSLVRATLSRSQLRRVQVYYFSGASYPIRFAYRKESYQWKIISEFIRIALAEKEKLRL